MSKKTDFYMAKLYGLAEAVFHQTHPEDNSDYIVAHLDDEEWQLDFWEMSLDAYELLQVIKGKLERLEQLEAKGSKVLSSVEGVSEVKTHYIPKTIDDIYGIYGKRENG